MQQQQQQQKHSTPTGQTLLCAAGLMTLQRTTQTTGPDKSAIINSNHARAGTGPSPHAKESWGKVGKGYSIFCFCFFFFSSVSSSASLQQNPGRRRGGARQHPCQSQLTLGSAPRDPPLTRAQFLLSSPPGIVRNRAVLSDFSALQKKKRKKKKKP
ncbi:uncharacterized protein CIMG_02443 [Coccidioides immitis RS]|uniref:Uncharacterized protein n=1 Tax=Coccidioides immitis (strain RS) TaxID=246410 RepID=J3KLE1_COCIM|nr:uncharacterized protein CIMG_02443 [Coccidioides immitis RS]EAS37089.3 hypothetical protein CIMG_02443 [Coccidioides immitis RS]